LRLETAPQWAGGRRFARSHHLAAGMVRRTLSRFHAAHNAWVVLAIVVRLRDRYTLAYSGQADLARRPVQVLCFALAKEAGDLIFLHH
jgi:hypothetical protein